MAGWNHDNANWKPKTCPVCGAEFIPRSGVHKFCSEPCKGKWKYISGEMTTESQYENISGNWRRYFSRLSAQKNRHGLNADILELVLARQKGKCALTGLDLTCRLEKGVKCWTNASIDRIDAGGPYEEWNIHLVCAAVNQWRGAVPIHQFIDVCRRIAANFPEGVRDAA